MRARFRGAALLAALLTAALIVGFAKGGYSKVKAGAEPEPLFKTDKYSLLIHYMHEIYEHYTVAGKLVKEKEFDKAITHIKILEYYIDLIPTAIPDKDREGKPVNKGLYTRNFQELKKFSAEVLKALESGEIAKGKPMPPPAVVTKTCDDCHKNQKIPPPW